MVRFIRRLCALGLLIVLLLTAGFLYFRSHYRDLIGELIERAGERAEILIGGGVNADVIAAFRRDFPICRTIFPKIHTNLRFFSVRCFHRKEMPTGKPNRPQKPNSRSPINMDTSVMMGCSPSCPPTIFGST